MHNFQENMPEFKLALGGVASVDASSISASTTERDGELRAAVTLALSRQKDAHMVASLLQPLVGDRNRRGARSALVQ